MKYTTRELVVAAIRDQIVDIRCSERDGLRDYANECRERVRVLFAKRHSAKLDRYGWPVIWKEMEARHG